MKYLSSVLLAMVIAAVGSFVAPTPAHAGTVVILQFTPPTIRNDSTALPATEILKYWLERSTSEFGTYYRLTSSDKPIFQQAITQNYYYRIVVQTIHGQEFTGDPIFVYTQSVSPPVAGPTGVTDIITTYYND